jgi:hypothetical protein
MKNESESGQEFGRAPMDWLGIDGNNPYLIKSFFFKLKFFKNKIELFFF